MGGLKILASIGALAILALDVRASLWWKGAPDTRVERFADGFEQPDLQGDWPEGAVRGSWRSEFDGFGRNGVALDGSRVLRLEPRGPRAPADTHAALVTSVRSFRDLDLTARLRTVKQLRLPRGAPWEVGWLLWHRTDNQHFYYLALKPNGWELGKADARYPGAQRFLATGSLPTFPVGGWHAARVRHTGNRIDVYGNGAHLASFVDDERPYEGGTLGLYTEDAIVHFDDVVVTPP